MTAPSTMGRDDLPPAGIELDERFHLFLGVGALHQHALMQRYGNGDCLHIATRAGVLSIRVLRDSSGIELTADLHAPKLDRISSGTRLLLQDDADINIVSPPGAIVDELHLRDHFFEIPRTASINAASWLRVMAPAHTWALQQQRCGEAA